MNHALKICSALIVFFLFLTSRVFANTAIEAQVDKKQLQLDETFTLTVIVIQETSPTSQIKHQDPELPSLESFSIQQTNSSENISVVADTMRIVLHHTYVLQPHTSGPLQIPSILYRYADEGQEKIVQTQPISVLVVDPAQSRIWFSMLFVLIILLVVSLGGGMIWVYHRKNRSLSHHTAYTSPYEEALKHLLNKKDAEQLELITGIQDTLKQYLQDRYQMDTLTKTTQEILIKLEHHPLVTSQEYHRIEACLKRCDQYRFQPTEHPLEAVEQLLSDVGDIFNELWRNSPPKTVGLGSDGSLRG